MKVNVSRFIDDNDLVIKTFNLALSSRELRAIKFAMDYLDNNRPACLNKEIINTNKLLNQQFKNIEKNDHI